MTVFCLTTGNLTTMTGDDNSSILPILSGPFSVSYFGGDCLMGQHPGSRSPAHYHGFGICTGPDGPTNQLIIHSNSRTQTENPCSAKKKKQKTSVTLEIVGKDRHVSASQIINTTLPHSAGAMQTKPSPVASSSSSHETERHRWGKRKRSERENLAPSTQLVRSARRKP